MCGRLSGSGEYRLEKPLNPTDRGLSAQRPDHLYAPSGFDARKYPKQVEHGSIDLTRDNHDWPGYLITNRGWQSELAWVMLTFVATTHAGAKLPPPGDQGGFVSSYVEATQADP